MGIPQLEPVSAIQQNYNVVLKKLVNGPVFLTQRSKTAAVLLSVNDYETMFDELARLRRVVQYDQQFAEIRAGNYVELLPETAA